jgi:hypothetical protein
MKKKPAQSEALVVMMTPELKEAVMGAAKGDTWQKMSASEFARQAIIEKLKRDSHVYPVRSVMEGSK